MIGFCALYYRQRRKTKLSTRRIVEAVAELSV